MRAPVQLRFGAVFDSSKGDWPITKIREGDKAPDFELQSTQAGKFKLSDYAGKKNVIVQFYVLDFTPT